MDSDKSLSPLVDESRPFTVPFRPYAWSGYSAPGLGPLVQPSLHPGMEADLGFYGDVSGRSALLAEEESFHSYRRHQAALLFHDRGLKAHEAKAQPDLLCPSLILNGAYKCIKCSKVSTRLNTLNLMLTEK